MRAKKTRAKISFFLDQRSAKTTSRVLKEKFYRASRAIYPSAKFKRKVPAGEVFIPAKQLSEEAQSAIERIRAAQKYIKHFDISERGNPSKHMVALLGIGTFFSAVGYPLIKSYPALGSAFVILGSFGTRHFFSKKSLATTTQAYADMSFLQNHLQSTQSLNAMNSARKSTRYIKNLRSKYNFFYVSPQLNGVVLSKLPVKTLESIGNLKTGEIVVVTKKTGELIYRGPDRRSQSDQRISARRSDEGKQTLRY